MPYCVEDYNIALPSKYIVEKTIVHTFFSLILQNPM